MDNNSPPPTNFQATQSEPSHNSGDLVIIIAVILILILGGLLFYLVPKLANPHTPQKPITQVTATPTIVPTTIAPTKTKTFINDFIRFSYPETAKQSIVGKNYTFDFPTSNFISYSMANMGSSTTINTWITKNEKCGTPTSRQGISFSTTAVTGIRIEKLGGCPPGASSVVDSFYFTTGKTIHILQLHKGGVKEISTEETSAFISLLNSIALATDTTGIK